MIPVFMEIVDTSIANVALPHMQGNLNAGTDEVTWVLTSYLISNAVILPMTGWLARVFGRKRFLITCIVLFTLSLPFSAGPRRTSPRSSFSGYCRARQGERWSR